MPSVEEGLAQAIHLAARRHESAVRNLAAAQEDLNAAGQLLAGLQQRMGKPSTATTALESALFQQIASRYGVSRTQLTGSSKQRPTTLARQLAIYLYLELTGATFLDAGLTFNRSQQTILYSLTQIKQRLKKSRLTRQLVKEIQASIQNGTGAGQASMNPTLRRIDSRSPYRRRDEGQAPSGQGGEAPRGKS